MKTFNTDDLGRMMGGAQLESANDLVRRTLAQHGLSMPDIAGFPLASMTAPPAPIPPGASFKADHFACAAGGRDYMVYVPASATEGVAGMVMMLHGCTQTHADFAAGTGMNELAETHRLIVVYPQQSRGENAQSCWNWFSIGDQRRGQGEPEILASLARHLAKVHAVPDGRIFVAGLSAGGAMAVILGQTYPEVFAAVGAHSGLPYGVARDMPSAFAAMTGTPTAEGTRRADAPVVPTILFHGSADSTVHPSNSNQIGRDVLGAGPVQTLLDKRSGQAGSRSFSCEITTTAEGRVLLEQWSVEGLGHAWSGGQTAGSFTDPNGPDASAEMVRFFLASAAS